MKVTNRMHGGLRQFHLTEAVLRYTNEAGESVATVNPVRHHPERAAAIGAGRGLSRDALAKTMRELSKQPVERTILPAHVLYLDNARALIHRPAERRPVFFHTGTAAFDAEMRNRQVLFPSLLLLVLPRSLYAWALADTERPTAETPLFRAPCMNLYDGGHMCAGTSKLPLEINLGSLPVAEKAFFETTFTHSNYGVGVKLTTHPEGHNGLWRALAEPKCRKFPAEWLAPFGKNVGWALSLESKR